MRSDRYVHPKFGLLSPTPRLRRELRMAFFSVLFGIGIGAATVIALSGNKTADDARVSGVSSDSVKSEQPTEAGSYFPPPVRRVDIPKADGGTRALGIAMWAA